MRTRQIARGLFALWSLAVVPAKADLQFLGQTRSVSAENSQGASSSASASSFDPFHGAASVAWEYTGDRLRDEESGLYSAEAGQDSTLLPYGITAQGYTHDHQPFFHYVDYAQSALSDVHVVFATEASCEFLLTGRLETWGDYGGTDYGAYLAKVELSDDAGPLLFASVNPAFPLPSGSRVLDIYETFAVNPGVYTLDVGASGEGCGGPYDMSRWGGGMVPGCGGSGAAEYDLRLVVIPAPAVLPLVLCGLGAVAFLKRRTILR